MQADRTPKPDFSFEDGHPAGLSDGELVAALREAHHLTAMFNLPPDPDGVGPAGLTRRDLGVRVWFNEKAVMEEVLRRFVPEETLQEALALRYTMTRAWNGGTFPEEWSEGRQPTDEIDAAEHVANMIADRGIEEAAHFLYLQEKLELAEADGEEDDLDAYADAAEAFAFEALVRGGVEDSLAAEWAAYARRSAEGPLPLPPKPRTPKIDPPE